jgi:DNA-binding SARP family transcriptional activator/TolB-like protein
MSQLFTLGRVRLVATDGVELATAQPKRLALLAYLAVTSARAATRRDAVIALFWPELGTDEARPALRQALYYLRRILGEDVFVGEGDEIRVREGALDCDAVDFERMLDAGRAEPALVLYGGDFLDGLHVDDVASEFDEWAARTRTRLRRRAAAAAWEVSASAEEGGDPRRALELARRACDLEPDQEGGWRRLISLHDRLGDPNGALRAYDALAARLAREFDARPAPETQALAELIASSEVRGVGGLERADDCAKSSRPEGPRQPESLRAQAPANARTRTPARLRTSAVVGIASLLLLATGAAYLAARDARATPSLITTGTLARRDRLLVADFADRADDSTLAAAVTEVLRTDLTQSPFVSVLTPRQVRTTLVKMRRAPDAAVDDSVAREVALRMGVKAFVTGSVVRTAGAYTVSVQLVGAESGEPLAAIRETAADSSRLLEAVDRAGKQLRHRIGETLRELRDMPPLTDVTTASLAALRRYTEANQLALAGRRTEAIPYYEQAIALDSTFAAAWSAMAKQHDAIGNLGRAREAAGQAFRHKAHLPFTDRSFLEASTAYARGDYDTAIEVYQRLLARYPDDYRALNNLALIHQDRRQFAAAESLFARAAQVDSTIANLYFGIEGTQLMQGKFADARRTLDLIARRFPDNPVLLTVEMQFAAAQRRWEDAERRAEAIMASVEGDTLSLVDPFEALALMATAQGRLAYADTLWRTHARLSAAAGSMGRHFFGVVRRAGTELRFRNHAARALAIVDSASARTPLDSLLPADRPYDELARLEARAGRHERARRLAAAADSNDRTLERQQTAERSWTRGVIALAEGRASDAEPLLRVAADQHTCTICALPDLGRAYEAEGKLRAATTVYERYLTTPWFLRWEIDALELGPVLQRLAALYDAGGERERAAAARAQLVQLWRRADAELQPAVAQARAGFGLGPR